MLSKALAIFGIALLPLSASAKAKFPDFRKMFKILEDNNVVYRAYNDSIHTKMSDEEFVGMMKRRGECFRRIYHENNQAISDMTDYFKRKSTKKPDAAYDSMYVCVQRVFDAYSLDNFLVADFAHILLPHYEKKGNSDILTNLRHISGYCHTEIARFSDEEAGETAKKLFLQNISMTDDGTPLTQTMKRIIVADFMNYCYTLASLGKVSPSEALKMTDKFQAFVEKHKSEMPEKIQKRWDFLIDRVRSRSNRIYQVTNINTKEDSLAFQKMAEYSPLRNASPAEMKTPEDSVFYYYYKADSEGMNVCTADSIVESLTRKILDNAEKMETPDEFTIQTIGNILSLNITLMENNPNLTEEEKIRRITHHCQRNVKIIQRTRIKNDPFFLESMLGHLACTSETFRYLPTKDKINYMSELAVKAQIGTLIHVDVVDRLAVVMFNGLLKHCPEQFVGVMGLNTVEDVLENKDMLAEWVGTAAAYHDLGKIGMSPIFNDDFRRLTEHEFKLSRMHPELALNYLNVDPVFDQFKDVALGHHKWYNGKGGYPDSFDNTQSPWRSYIDLVTICDCIDAATDDINRNYRKAKTLTEVLVEFKRDAGKLYNPVMIEALCNDAELCKQIEEVITEQRSKLLNKVRNRYIK